MPTPIGNLGDITFRALDTLRKVDVIACEDTRTSSKLLKHYDIVTPCVSYHEHNERSRAPQLVERMQGGETVALISDAGTPGISDPGFYLARECWRAGIRVEVLPGASAVITALVASGLPCERFVFEGFLPAKKGRKSRIQNLAEEERTVVLYESPHRAAKTMRDLAEALGPGRRATVVRELTKIHEEVLAGTVSELAEILAARERVRGEIVIVVEGSRRGGP